MSQPDLPALYAAHLDTLKQRADAALAKGGFDCLLIPSGTVHYQAFDDIDYPYHVNPHFKHWLPLTDAPGSWLHYTPGKRPQLIYLQPHDYWHVVPQDPQGEWVEHFDIRIVRSSEEATKLLPPASVRAAVLGEAQSAQAHITPNNPEAVLNWLDYHRAYKTPYEIALMREANRIGVRAHRAAEQLFRAGASEFAIHLGYCHAAGQDSNQLPYNNIIALNQHAAILHYTARAHLPPHPTRSFLIDAGASYRGYASDITRTYSARNNDEFKALIDAVDQAQRALCDAVRPGTDYRQIHLDAHLALSRILKDFGLISIYPEVAVETGISAAFFPHGIGHGIGLQVHDVAGFAQSPEGGILDKPKGHPYLRLTRTLEPGMVVTIEPGIYFIDMLLEGLRTKGHSGSVNWTKIAQLKSCGGIRIEDNVVCTEDAPINLTREAEAELR